MKRMDRFDRPLVWKDGEVFSFCVDRCNNETNVEILRRTAMVPTFFEYSVNVWYIQWAYVWLHVKWRNLKISVWDFFFLYSTFFYIFPFRVSMYIKRKIDERSMHRVSVSFEFVATLFSGIWYTIYFHRLFHRYAPRYISHFLFFSFRRKIATRRIRLKLRGRVKSLGRASKPSSPHFIVDPSRLHDPQWSQFSFSKKIVLQQCRHSDVIRNPLSLSRLLKSARAASL